MKKTILLVTGFYFALLADLAIAESKDPSKQFDFLIGHWECTYQAVDAEGELGQAYPCTWDGKYTFDGNMVQDDFKMFNKDGAMVFAGTTLRTYVAQKQRWDLAFLGARNGHWPNFHGVWKEGEIHINSDGVDQRGNFKAKIRFYDIKEDSFMWDMHKSYDEGKTWALDSVIKPVRKNA